MKTLGMIGGIGPESTVEYYHSIIRLWRERTADGSYPSIIINSINLTRIVGLFEANNLAGAAQFLIEEIGRLGRAGAEFALLSANTPHLVF